MRKCLLFLIFFLAVGWVACEKTISQSDVSRMTKGDLKARLGTPDLVLIDVRYGKDWTGSNQKITGAIREDPDGVNTWGAKYPKDKTLVLYCA